MRALAVIPRIAGAALASLIVYGCAGSPVAIAKMDSNEITRVNDTLLCSADSYFKYANIFQVSTVNIQNEVQRRNLNCGAATPQTQYAQSGGSAKIELSDSAACSGISIGQTGMGQFYAAGVYGLYVTINNASGRRKSVVLDVKLYEGGTRTAYLNVPSGEHWEQKGPFVLRSDESSGTFVVKTQPGRDDRITAVTVLGCS